MGLPILSMPRRKNARRKNAWWLDASLIVTVKEVAIAEGLKANRVVTEALAQQRHCSEKPCCNNCMFRTKVEHFFKNHAIDMVSCVWLPLEEACVRQGSNLQPLAPEANALSN